MVISFRFGYPLDFCGVKMLLLVIHDKNQEIYSNFLTKIAVINGIISMIDYLNKNLILSGGQYGLRTKTPCNRKDTEKYR